jgi:hypothetical protein
MVYHGYMSKHEYMAGLIDGEGSIILSHSSNKAYRAPSLSIASTTPELVEWCKENYGGFISTKKVYQEHHRPSWVWQLASWDKLTECLSEVLPYMLEPNKRARARMILEEYKPVNPRNGKYTEAMRLAKLSFEERFLALK